LPRLLTEVGMARDDSSVKQAKRSPIEFRREIMPSRMLKRDQSGEMVEVAATVELRFDPLTGRTGRLVPYSVSRIIRPDLAALEKRSRELTCPFCPPLVERITPRFPADLFPEGVIRQGKAFAFPNQDPYDVYGVVVVITDEHFVTIDRLDHETVLNALTAAHTYIKRVREVDARAEYSFIAWNYMPPAGGSLVHPHLQCNAGYHPTNFQRQMLGAADRYFEEKHTNYWVDLVEEEKRTGERWVGTTGGVQWLTGFAPRGRLGDVIAVFPEKASLADLTGADLSDFTEGLIKVAGYFNELNLISFNMSTYSGLDNERFRVHARITPRGQLLYSSIETSDQFYYQILQDETICILPPEGAAAGLRKRFQDG
jgi:UDPglucose--hexose-1-phosphate uridylyltransferase